MDEYISREAVLNLIEHNDKVCHYADERYENVVYATTQTICKVVAEMPAADVQPVDKIAKIIQARLNGVQKVKIDAMLSGDCNTAYKMVGAETVCIAILQDLEAIKG